MKQNRLLSPVVWATIATHVLAILLTLDVIDTGVSDAVNQVVAGVLQLLTLFGVLNNPTDKAHF